MADLVAPAPRQFCQGARRHAGLLHLRKGGEGMTSAALAPTGVPALSERERRMYRGGIWLLIIAETMVFITLFSTRFLLPVRRAPVGTGEPVGASLTDGIGRARCRA